MNIHVAVKVPNVQTLVTWQKSSGNQCRPRSDCSFRSSPIRVFTVCYSDKRFCESKTQQTISFVETWSFPMDPKCSIIHGFHCICKLLTIQYFVTYQPSSYSEWEKVLLSATYWLKGFFIQEDLVCTWFNELSSILHLIIYQSSAVFLVFVKNISAKLNR